MGRAEPGSNPLLNQLDKWRPAWWCAAIIQLCAAFEHEGEGGRSRYPAQWAYLLWVPTDAAIPQALPDGWGIGLEPPWEEIAADLAGAAVFVMPAREVDWPTLLDILRECGDPAPWLLQVIRQVQRTKRRMRQRRFLELYGEGDNYAFERFMHGALMKRTES
jgi:hypothetical protein